MSNAGFSTAGMSTETGKRVSMYLAYGIQNFRINSIETKISGTGSIQLLLNVETPKVLTEGFTPDASALNGGQVGRVLFPKYYMSGKEVKDYIGGTPVQCSDFEACIRRIGIIADKLGVRSALDAIQVNGTDIEAFKDYISQAAPVICGHFANWKVTAEEYLKEGNKKGNRLSLAHYGFIAENTKEGAESLKFDKTSTFDYKVAEVPDAQPAGATPGNSLPF